MLFNTWEVEKETRKWEKNKFDVEPFYSRLDLLESISDSERKKYFFKVDSGNVTTLTIKGWIISHML